MSKIIDIKVKDQFSKVIEAKALLRSFVEQHQHDAIDLVKKNWTYRGRWRNYFTEYWTVIWKSKVFKYL